MLLARCRRFDHGRLAPVLTLWRVSRKVVSKSKKLNTEIRVKLREAFGPPEHAIFFEVAAGTGYEGRRRVADAVAMGMWPSRGMQITGFEIKVARHDWLREKDNPEKAEEIAAYCDRWALVSAAGIVEPKEVPHAWDWYELNENGVLVLHQRGHETEAKPLDRSFVASLLRCAGRADKVEIEFEVEKRIEAELARIDERVEQLANARSSEPVRIAKRYAQIEEMLNDSGFRSNGEIAEAIRIVLKSGVANTYQGLGDLSKQLIRMSEKITAALPSPIAPVPGGDEK